MKDVLYFNVSDFVITGDTIPLHVADKILKNFIWPLQRIRIVLGAAIWASQKSGYRPESWEKFRGRSGNSQHCFKLGGACDLTWSGDIDMLLDALIEHTEFTRMAVYYDNNTQFIHIDMKPTGSGKREIYKSTPSSNWTFLRFA